MSGARKSPNRHKQKTVSFRLPDQVMERMRALGVRVAVSSNNGIENVATFASQADFRFDLVLGFGDGLAKGKPHLDKSARIFKVDRQEMLFVGRPGRAGDERRSRRS